MANNPLWAKSKPRPVFVSKGLLKQPRPFVYLLSMDAFHAVMAELNSFGRDTVACKAWTIYYLDLWRKNVMTPAKMHQLSKFQKCVVLSWLFLSCSFALLGQHATLGKLADETTSRQGFNLLGKNLDACLFLGSFWCFSYIAEVFHGFRFKETFWI